MTSQLLYNDSESYITLWYHELISGITSFAKPTTKDFYDRHYEVINWHHLLERRYFFLKVDHDYLNTNSTTHNRFNELWYDVYLFRRLTRKTSRSTTHRVILSCYRVTPVGKLTTSFKNCWNNYSGNAVYVSAFIP